MAQWYGLKLAFVLVISKCLFLALQFRKVNNFGPSSIQSNFGPKFKIEFLSIWFLGLFLFAIVVVKIHPILGQLFSIWRFTYKQAQLVNLLAKMRTPSSQMTRLWSILFWVFKTTSICFGFYEKFNDQFQFSCMHRYLLVTQLYFERITHSI